MSSAGNCPALKNKMPRLFAATGLPGLNPAVLFRVTALNCLLWSFAHLHSN
jgi:hypothetical protein